MGGASSSGKSPMPKCWSKSRVERSMSSHQSRNGVMLQCDIFLSEDTRNSFQMGHVGRINEALKDFMQISSLAFYEDWQDNAIKSIPPSSLQHEMQSKKGGQRQRKSIWGMCVAHVQFNASEQRMTFIPPVIEITLFSDMHLWTFLSQLMKIPESSITSTVEVSCRH